MSDYKNLFESAVRWQDRAKHFEEESHRYEKAWLAEAERAESFKEAYEATQRELAEFRSMALGAYAKVAVLEQEAAA